MTGLINIPFKSKSQKVTIFLNIALSHIFNFNVITFQNKKSNKNIYKLNASIKTMKKSLAVGFVFVLLISILFASISFATADTIGSKVTNKLGSIGNALKGTTSLTDDTKATISKVMLMFLLAIVVYAISTFLPFFPKDKPWLQWVFAIVIAILGFMFVSVGEVKLLLTNYMALGIALTTIIPLILIVTFTLNMRKKNTELATIVNKPLVLIFLLYLFVSWWNFDTDKEKVSSALNWIYIITMLATLAWLMFENKIIGRIYKNVTDSMAERAKDKIRRATEMTKLRAGEFNDLGKDS